MLYFVSQALGLIGSAANFLGYNHHKPYQALEQQEIVFKRWNHESLPSLTQTVSADMLQPHH